MIGEILQLLVLALALVAYFRYARRLKGSLYLIFTALSSATLLLSLTYYLAHTYIREGMRVPFAANDIADFDNNAPLTKVSNKRHQLLCTLSYSF